MFPSLLKYCKNLVLLKDQGKSGDFIVMRCGIDGSGIWAIQAGQVP